ncbi:RNA polymerase subunit sigma-70 [Rugosimonospora africana]|nr:RNA polymerase subunit sigma-70 [Rugosimonospora africana]
MPDIDESAAVAAFVAGDEPAAVAAGDELAAVAAATAGDESAFATLVRRHERELHVHCYRMLGSFEEAEDVVQETFLRAWDKRGTFEGGSGFRAWLYRIATNACLDALRRRSRRPVTSSSPSEVPWLQPYPDRLLNEIAPREEEPDAVAVDRETIELAFLAAVQLLPPRQRAVLILRDVLGWSAGESAEALDLTVASANSALQRARATMREQLPRRRLDWSTSEPSAEERDLLLRFIDAHERADIAASIALMREDIRVTMPPHPFLYDGIEAVSGLVANAFGPAVEGEWRLVPTSANRQPTAASYLLAPGDSCYRAFKLDVLRVEGDKVAEITTFDATLFPSFGLPATLPLS